MVKRDYASEQDQIVKYVVERSLEYTADIFYDLRVMYEGKTPSRSSKWYFWTITSAKDYFLPDDFRKDLYQYLSDNDFPQTIWGTMEWYPQDSPKKKGLHFHGVSRKGKEIPQVEGSPWRTFVIPINTFSDEKNAVDLSEMSERWDYINQDVKYTETEITRYIFNRIQHQAKAMVDAGAI